MTTMIALVGEQPQPNLIPALHLKPAATLLVYTSFTQSAYERQRILLENAGIKVHCLKCSNEFEAVAVAEQLHQKLSEPKLAGERIFNITGGTKAMVLAATQCCRTAGSRLIYLETSRNKSRLYTYRHDLTGQLILEESDEVPPVLSIRQFLDAQLGMNNWHEYGYSKDIGGDFERAVGEAIRCKVDEIATGVRFLGNNSGSQPQADLDIVVRVANQFGVVEVKDRAKATLDAIKQLHYLSMLLGTYTVKFWALSRKKIPEHEAVIDVTRTTVIELESYKSGALDDNDQAHLVESVLGRFR